MEKNRRKRVHRQRKECSLVVILICTVGTFFVSHLPRYVIGIHLASLINLSRILTSVYEAATYNAQENCKTKNLEFLPLWFLYSIVTMNGLLVSVLYDSLLFIHVFFSLGNQCLFKFLDLLIFRTAVPGDTLQLSWNCSTYKTETPSQLSKVTLQNMKIRIIGQP